MNPTGSKAGCTSGADLGQSIVQKGMTQDQLENQTLKLINYLENVSKRLDLQAKCIYYMQMKELINPTGSKAECNRASLEEGIENVVRSRNELEAWAEDFKKLIEQMEAEKLNEQKKEAHVAEGHTYEENEEVKFNNWAKVRGFGLTKIRLDNTIRMLRDQTQKVSGYKQIVADMLNLYKSGAFSDEKFKIKKFLEAFDAPELPFEFQGAITNATDEPKIRIDLESTETNKESASFPPDAKLNNSAELLGPSSLAESSGFSLLSPHLSSISSALRKDESLPWQKPKQAEKKEKISPKKLVDMVNKEGNKEVMPKQRAKLLQKKEPNNKTPDLDQRLNLSTSISPDKFFFDLSAAALPITGGFSFGARNNTSSVAPNPMTKSNTNGSIRCAPFRFSASAVVAPPGPSGSSVLKPVQQKLRCLFHNKVEELLFVIQANLYRLIDGDWIMRGPGQVKIWRHLETRELRVSMQQNQLLKVCLNHLLTIDVVYRPMDRKSWIFAAYDLNGGKSVLERFILRFKDRIAAQEFISAVRSALNGTAQARERETAENTGRKGNLNYDGNCTTFRKFNY